MPPPSSVIAALSVEGAEAIEAFNAYEASLPAHRSHEQLIKLDELRAAAFSRLGPDLFVNLAAERAELLETLKQEVATLQTDWRRLEELEALSHWRQCGQRDYSARPLVCSTVQLGMGMTQPITSRELLAAMRATLARVGG